MENDDRFSLAHRLLVTARDFFGARGTDVISLEQADLALTAFLDCFATLAATYRVPKELILGRVDRAYDAAVKRVAERRAEAGQKAN